MVFVVVFVYIMFSGLIGTTPLQSEARMKGDMKMATYMMQFGFTQQGIQKIKESPARVEAAKKTVRDLGEEVKAFYAILGSQYDTVFILEALNDEAVAKMAIAISSLGFVRTVTHRIFTEDEFRKIVSSLS